MLLDPRPRRFTDVETDVEAVGSVKLAHRGHQVLDRAHHFAQRLDIDIGEITAVLDRCHHRVPSCVGVEVEECEGSGITPQSQGRTIVLGLESTAENALAPVSRFSRRYVLEPPWGEEDLVHRRSLLEELFPEIFPRLEVRDLFGWHVNLLPGLRIAADPFAPLSDPE